MQRHLFLFRIAAESVLINKVRGFLTALGVVFGVAAVIAMLAIGSGAKKFILDQMRLIGTNNIVFEHKTPGKDSEAETEEESTATTANNESELDPWAPGMSVQDVKAISQSIPGIEHVSPEIINETKAIYNGKILDVRCVGVTNAFFPMNQLTTSKGAFFTEEHIESRKPVCVIGKNVETKLFSGRNPLGQTIKCGNNYFTIIGVLEKRIATKETLSSLGLRDLNSDIFIPLEASLMRFGDRSRIRREHLGREGRNNDDETEMHQIDRLVVRVHDTKTLQPTADVIARMLKRRHMDRVDFSMEIPELLLQQEQKTQDIFNLVLAVIAGISLLVGGIGIMNIMLASVYERIKEIGLRRAIGATSQDIVLQFLYEAILVSIIGGILGVLLGVSAAKAISTTAEIPTMISWWSIVLSFCVAASIGLIFGIVPAQKAAKLDPIEALRTE
jgi:putative ABC transport system permease protein